MGRKRKTNALARDLNTGQRVLAEQNADRTQATPQPTSPLVLKRL